METKDWWLVAAAIIGPILAVLATRVVDVWREGRDRKNAVFVSLMSTRRAQLTPEHVNALNRIELEFANNSAVIAELKTYMMLMEEKVPPLSRYEKDEAVKRAHFHADEDLTRRRRRAFGTLVQAIGRKLGKRVDRHDIIEGGYYPGGWAEAETLQLDNMRRLNDILNWKVAFPMHLWRVSPPVPLEGRERPNEDPDNAQGDGENSAPPNA